MAIWIGLSGAVIMYNKYLLAYRGFPYPITLTMWCVALGWLLPLPAALGWLLPLPAAGAATHRARGPAALPMCVQYVLPPPARHVAPTRLRCAAGHRRAEEATLPCPAHVNELNLACPLLPPHALAGTCTCSARRWRKLSEQPLVSAPHVWL